MRVLGEIARGGFGIVERVRFGSGEIVARKTFSPSVPLTPDELTKLRKRFQREVRTLVAFSSHSFIPVLGADLDGEHPWFLMPMADRSLAEEIAAVKGTGVIPKQAFEEVLNALEEMHESGLIHRDLKPSNVLFHQGIWKLSDFGLVLPQTGATTNFTSTASAWGTATYAAPEQAIDFHAVGPGADIYAFGCILHDVFGEGPRVPFRRQTADGPIGAVIEKCTEPHLSKRFKSVAALRGALLTLLSGETSGKASAKAVDWAGRLAKVTDWDAEIFQDFVRAVTKLSTFEDKHAVLRALDEEAVRTLHTLDPEAWKVVAMTYCEWTEGNFVFSYCDVVVQRLEEIFHLGDLETKAYAATAAAGLGASHNRWYVMRRVLKMCSPSLEPAAASRIAIEIQAREAEHSFRRCARGIDRDYAAFHPAIERVIRDGSET